jgi:transcriptional regulator GlxA family with amidase domain
MEPQPEPTSIAIALFDGAEELDWAGPWEVLAAWAAHWPDDGVEVFTLAQHDAPVACAKGLRVLPDHTWASAPSIDVLVYPGGHGTRAQLDDEEVLAWIRDVHRDTRITTSVCTGALVLAAAGVLDGRRVTTHWASLDLLATLGEDLDVTGEERFVDTGDVITAAGVSAGIDMALHLVVRLAGEDRARQVRRFIQYDPEPPV